MINGGGGSSAENGGGLNDGALKRCIGREAVVFWSALCTWAWLGMVNPPLSLLQLRCGSTGAVESPLANIGEMIGGVFRRISVAPGHPHSNSSVIPGACPPEV